MTAQEILKLIEEVDPADTKKLDEIDDKVATYIFYGLKDEIQMAIQKPKMFTTWNESEQSGDLTIVKRHWKSSKQYTRSRDALKAIRPEGWGISITDWDYGWTAYANKRGTSIDFKSREKMQTEELAELSAIIKAIDWSRVNGM